jgi:Zn-dependent protease
MDGNALVDGLIMYLGLVMLLTLHEFGHAWTAWKCGDDTAYNDGRVSINPLVHIDPIGTVLLPLLALTLTLMGSGYASLIVGWARPVPVNLNNLRHPTADDVIITLAGPGMNLLLAFALAGLARLGMTMHLHDMRMICSQFGQMSLLLCFFNMIPIPPLDGSHILRILIRMSYETYYRIASIGMFLVIVVMQIHWVNFWLLSMTDSTWDVIARMFGMRG